MARDAVARRGVSIRLACEAFGVSQTCYRYERQRNAENEQIADWLLRLTDNHCGFNRSMQRFDGIVQRVYRSLVFYADVR